MIRSETNYLGVADTNGSKALPSGTPAKRPSETQPRALTMFSRVFVVKANKSSIKLEI